MELVGAVGLAVVPSIVCWLCCRCQYQHTPAQPPPRRWAPSPPPPQHVVPCACDEAVQTDNDVFTVKVEVHSSSSGAGSDEMSSSDISERGSGSGAGGEHDYEDIYLVRAEAGSGAPRSRSRDSGSHSRSASVSSTHSNVIVTALSDESHLTETAHVHHVTVHKTETIDTKHCEDPSHKGKQKLNHSHSMPYHAANSRALKRVVSEPGSALPPPPPPPPLDDLSLSSPSPDSSLPPARAEVHSSHSSVSADHSSEENTTARASSVSPDKPEAESPEPRVTEVAAEEPPAPAGPNLVNKQMVLPFIPPKFPSSGDGDEHSLIKPSEYLRALGNKGQPPAQAPATHTLTQPAKVVDVHPHPHTQPVPVHSFQTEDKTGSVLSVSVGPPPPPLPEPVSPPPPTTPASRKADQPLGTISIQDLNSVQLRRTNKTLTKTMSAPPASLTGTTEAPMQVVKHDLIEELKKSKDITGIKKMKVEKVKMEEQHEKELVTEIHKQLSVDSFVEKIPEKDATGNPIPPWKRQMLAKKAAEKARKEMEEALARQAEEKRIQAIPAWKRQLMQAKKPEEKLTNGTHIAAAPVFEDKKPMPTVHIIENSPTKENKENNKPANKEPELTKEEDAAPIMPWRAQLRKTNSTLNLLE